METILGNVTYEEFKVPHWNNSICEKIIKSLYDTQKPFKYMGNEYTVTSLIMQKTEAALQTSTACYFEGGTDSILYTVSLQFLWPKEKAKDQSLKTMYCVVTLFCATF